MSASIISRRDRKQNNSYLHHTSNKTLKIKNHRILKPAQTSNLNVFDDRQIAQQLTHEMNKIEQVINAYTLEFQKARVNKNNKAAYEDKVFALEESIRQADKQIKTINAEIQVLKFSKHNQVKENRQIHEYPQVFTLTEQLKNQGNRLKELIKAHSSRISNHKMLFLAVHNIQKIFIATMPEREISYQIFKERSQQFRRDEQWKGKKKESKIPVKRQRPQTIEHSAIGGRNDIDGGKSLKELHDKKRKMQLAIKNAKKKHIVEIDQLSSKLQFLRDEDALLTDKIRELESQSQNLELKFNMNKKNRLRSRGLFDDNTFAQNIYL